MSDMTIEVPADQLDGIHEALVAARDDLAAALEHEDSTAAKGSDPSDGRERLAGLDRLLEQLESGASRGGQRPLTGPRETLWDALYDAFCAAAEQLERDCNDYWRGEIESAHLRARIAGLERQLHLLDSVGPPPDPADPGDG